MMSRKDKAVLLTLAVLLIIPGMLALLALPFIIMFGGKEWSWAALRSFDRVCNVALTNGSEFQTISGQSWEKRNTFLGWFLVWFLDFFEKDHCRLAWEHEETLKAGATSFLETDDH